MPLGHMYQIVGNVQEYNGKYQISGIEYTIYYPKKTNTHIVQYDYYMTFNSDIAFDYNYSATLYSDITVTEEVKTEGNVTTFKGTAQKTTQNGDGKTVEFTFAVSNELGLSVNDKFSTSAYQFEEDSNVLTIKTITKKQ